jgi:16S rRNA (guanine527-N7)-methyltransferase
MDACAGMGLELSPAMAGRMVALLDRVSLEPQNLTAIEDVDEGVDRHLADSLSGLGAPELAGPSVVDLGSGAGFPGIPLAMVRQDLRFTLVESERRKARWLAEASAGLPNVRVVADRSEHLARREREAHGTVLARALAHPVPALELAAPLVAPGGTVLIWSTEDDAVRSADALAEAGDLLGLEGLPPREVRPFPGARRRLLGFRKVAPTPGRYPRRPGRAVARPLGGR